MLAKKFLPLLFLSLLLSGTYHRGQAHFDLTFVRAKDLRKLTEEVQQGASLEGLNQVVDTVPSPDGNRIAYAERVHAGVESLLYGIYVSNLASTEMSSASPSTLTEDRLFSSNK